MNEKRGILTNRYNVGISILRLVMSFIVICNHFKLSTHTQFGILINHLCPLAVPCFMFVSFYLLSDKIESKKYFLIIRSRCQRLLIPLFGWSIIYYFFESIYFGEIIDYRNLIYSFVFGSSEKIMAPLWFLSTQLILVIFMVVVYICTENYGNRYLGGGISINLFFCSSVYEYELLYV